MTWETFEITIAAAGGGGLPGAGIGEIDQIDATQSNKDGFGGDRPSGYGSDQVYVENAWEDIAGQLVVAGGGRWQQQLIFVGKGVIYFEEIS